MFPFQRFIQWFGSQAVAALLLLFLSSGRLAAADGPSLRRRRTMLSRSGLRVVRMMDENEVPQLDRLAKRARIPTKTATAATRTEIKYASRRSVALYSNTLRV